MRRPNEEYVREILKGVLEASVRNPSGMNKNGFAPMKLTGTEVLEICKYLNNLDVEIEASDLVGTIEN